MNVFAGSGAHKYAKASKVEYKVVHRDPNTIAFIAIIAALLIAAVVFAAVLMAKGRKSPDHGAKKAKKKADKKAEAESYEKILSDKK
jgi:flagellar basal body-associated protein FliL